MAHASIHPSQEPSFLSYEELKTLSEGRVVEGPLYEKLEKFWVTPTISNEAYYRNIKPFSPHHSEIGKSLILGTWNIEKSIHMERVINLSISEKAFELMIDRKKAPPGSRLDQLIHEQRNRFLLADIIVLQEMDIGVKRSQYRNAAKALAEALDMNYVYAPEYLEIDPVTLGLEEISLENGAKDTEAMEYFKVDPRRYKGVFGSAVLSRYPIKHVEVHQLKHQPYDWYGGEKSKTTFLENVRRFGTKTIFKNEITREIKIGGRIFFRVDLEVPELPEKTLTVINIHLEIKCLPKDRTRQMQEILSYLQDINHPVIVAGDFNAAPEDLSSTSVTRVAVRALKNPTNWLALAVNTISPHALAVNVTRAVSNVTKNFQDPTSRNVPILAPNPVESMFQMIEDYRFNDGGVFDFRGERQRSLGRKKGTLANSNQRDFKGFKTTFKVIRPIGRWVGKFRLDWIFVKSFLKNFSRDQKGSYRFAPHYGETLEELNTSLTAQLSDHHPSIVYLPFEEPQLKN